MHGGVRIGNLITLDRLLEQLIRLRVGVLNRSNGLDRKIVIHSVGHPLRFLNAEVNAIFLWGAQPPISL